MSDPGSPLVGPFLPNSLVRSGRPTRHSERNMRFPSGMRNLAGVPWELGTQKLVVTLMVIGELLLLFVFLPISFKFLVFELHFFFFLFMI